MNFTAQIEAAAGLCRHSDLRMRDIANKVNITERAVQRVVHDLVEEGYLIIEKEGRCNQDRPILDAHLRHSLESGITIAELFVVFQNNE